MAQTSTLKFAGVLHDPKVDTAALSLHRLVCSDTSICVAMWWATDGYTYLWTITPVRIPHFGGEMPHLEEFFTHGGGAAFCAGSHAPEAAQPSAREGEELRDGGLLFLHGPQDAGQTSLLLQFGFSQVQAGRSVVLVMCGSAGASQQPAASQIVPLSPCARCRLPVQTGEDNGVWGRIHIKYLRSNAELQHFLCSLHVVGKETSVLLVEGFERFFADQSHMGSVYQTLAFLLEAQEYMKKATGSGVVVVTGNTDAFLLRDRPLLRRWCRFLEIVPDVEEPDVYTLREEVEDTADVGDDVARVQVRYEFSLPSSQDDIGTFQLQHVQRHSG